MKRIKLVFVTLFWGLLCSSQQPAFGTLEDRSMLPFHDYLPSMTTPTTASYYASPIEVAVANWKIVGLQLRFEPIDLTEMEAFEFRVYEDASGLPGTLLFSEAIHKHNYFCNQVIGADDILMDLFLRNPITLESGAYWVSVHASANVEPETPIQMRTVTSNSATAKWNGVSWETASIDMDFKLYGDENVFLIETFPYVQSFAPEGMHGWSMADLFPTGIDGFIITEDLWSPSDSNASSLRISGFVPSDSPWNRFIFYNVTTPKFKFLAGHTYEITMNAHHPVWGSQVGGMGAFGLVFVPDPPSLGFLELVGNGGSGGIDIFNSDFNLDPPSSNMYFQERTLLYTPNEDIETRFGIHMEFGDLPLDVRVDFWLDAFSIEDVTPLSMDDVSLQEEMLRVYPNPGTNLLSIRTQKHIQHLRLLDMYGKKVLETHASTIDTAQLMSGLYVLEIVFDDAERMVKKWIKH